MTTSRRIAAVAFVAAVVAPLVSFPALASDITLRPVGSPAALTKLHRAFVEAAKGGIDHIIVTVDGKVVGDMILGSMSDPSGVLKSHPTDPGKDVQAPHPAGAARANVYEYRLVAKPPSPSSP